MALIWRCVFEANDAAIKVTGPQIVERWLQRKGAQADLQLPPVGQTLEFETKDRFDGGSPVRNDLSVALVESDDTWAHRVAWTEQKAAETVTTSCTLLVDHAGSHVWIDLDRWGAQAFSDPWIPKAPGLVADYLRSLACSIGSAELSAGPRRIDRSGAEQLAHFLLDPDRRIPVVVVSGRSDDSPSIARQRAEEIEERLRGVADVVALQPGASTQISRVLYDQLGPGFDVFNGAIRTYLPGLAAGSSKWAHRLISPASLMRRPPKQVGEIVAQSLQRAACAQPLPESWTPVLRDTLLGRVGSPVGKSDEHAEAFELASDELAKTEKALRDIREELFSERSAREDAQRQIEDVRVTAAETEEEAEKLRARVEWLETQLAEAGRPAWGSPEQPEIDLAPETCGELPERVDRELSHVSFPSKLWAPADDLDLHISTAWAKRAWRAFVAFNAYAQAKQSGQFEGNFLKYCADGNPRACPATWVALRESETTDNNPRYRNLRTFAVDPDSTSAGDEIYMPAHIKIEPGGNPAPRIHFHDDTGGTTGKIHIGYFGVHLDNKSKT